LLKKAGDWHQSIFLAEEDKHSSDEMAEARRGNVLFNTYPLKLQLLQTNMFHFPQKSYQRRIPSNPGYLFIYLFIYLHCFGFWVKSEGRKIKVP